MSKELIEKTQLETAEMLKDGEIDMHGCVRLMFDLIRVEKYEMCEGIKRAAESYGIKLEIPETEKELMELLIKLNNDKKAFKKGYDNL